MYLNKNLIIQIDLLIITTIQQDENRLMDYHQNLKDNKFDQLCLAGVHYLRSHYQEATDIYKKYVSKAYFISI